jgi:hypothetical protein
MRLEKLRKLKKSNYLIGNRTRDLLACSTERRSVLDRTNFSKFPTDINLGDSGRRNRNFRNHKLLSVFITFYLHAFK